MHTKRAPSPPLGIRVHPLALRFVLVYVAYKILRRSLPPPAWPSKSRLPLPGLRVRLGPRWVVVSRGAPRARWVDRSSPRWQRRPVSRLHPALG